MTEEIKEEVVNVCNYGSALTRRGMAQGITQGITQDQNWQKRLYITLRDAGRMDEYDRCMTDDAYKEKMYVDLGIKQKTSDLSQ